MKKNTPIVASESDNKELSGLFQNIQGLIEQAKNKVQTAANSVLVTLNWRIGNIINGHVLDAQRAAYGEKIIIKLAEQLASNGYKYSVRTLRRTVQFAKLYPDFQKVSTLLTQLSWSHFIQLLSIEDELKRDFYAMLCNQQKWDVRTLENKIDGMLYERTVLSKQPAEIIIKELQNIRQNTPTPYTTLKDPYVLDFLGLDQNYSEGDLENAIINELQKVIQELGSDFCFVARQKRLSTDKTDRYLDLLFYHRGMRRLVAVELKLGKFQPEHKGQMEWYLRYLDKYERRTGEESPLGIILCADKDDEDIKLLELDQSGIHVAQYLTQLPPRNLFEQKLRDAVEMARLRFDKSSGQE